MLSNDLIDNLNLRQLVEQIKITNPDVLQVRFHSPVDPQKIALLGEDGAMVVCVLESSPAKTPPEFVKIISMVPSSVYNNSKAWESVANDVKVKIANYKATGLRFIENANSANVSIDKTV